ncbi:OmpA family protein [Shimia sp. R10_1]|uniref:OmpA family protein n=1 Tax=Shimia sp. R10_1 TaxID=2821095 RepID=UPI001ADAACB6|nr:OmpA family protein [Shimia sp. R10_1]MBO9472722.1 OmpA family protein [Shimia sp. R10_1]
MFRLRVFGLCLPLFFLPFAAVSAPRELAVSADRCAIFFALTGQVAHGCAPPPLEALGRTRKLSPQGYDTGAASLESADGDQGYFIRFPFNSDQLTAEYTAHLARLGRVLTSEQLAGSCIKLVGHADSVGGAAYNQTLSAARARVVADNLASVSKVPRSRLLTEARGERALLAGIPGAHPLNRRVEILARKMEGATCQ